MAKMRISHSHETNVTSHHQSRLITGLLFGVLFPLFLFIIIGTEIWLYGGINGEISILRYLHQHVSPQRDRLMILITHLGSGWSIIALAIVIALFFTAYKRRREAAFLLLAVGGAAVLGEIVKIIVQRPRPHLWLSSAPEFGYSFPSEHSMVSMAFVLALIVLLGQTRWRWCAIIAGSIAVLAVGLSRLYLGVHYPSDVLGAWCASMAWVLGNSFYWGWRKFTVFSEPENQDCLPESMARQESYHG